MRYYIIPQENLTSSYCIISEKALTGCSGELVDSLNSCMMLYDVNVRVNSKYIDMHYWRMTVMQYKNNLLNRQRGYNTDGHIEV